MSLWGNFLNWGKPLRDSDFDLAFFLRVLNIKYSRYSRRQNVIIVIISFWNMKWMSQRGISLVLIWSLFPLWLKRRTHAAAQLYILIYGSWISVDSLFNSTGKKRRTFFHSKIPLEKWKSLKAKHDYSQEKYLFFTQKKKYVICIYVNWLQISIRFARTLDYRQKSKRHLGDFLPYFDKCLKGRKSSNAWS